MIPCKAVTNELGQTAWADGSNPHQLHIAVGETQVSYDPETGSLKHRVYGAGKRSDRKEFEWSIDMTNFTKSLYR